MNKADITPALVSHLLSAQFPHWAHHAPERRERPCLDADGETARFVQSDGAALRFVRVLGELCREPSYSLPQTPDAPRVARVFGPFAATSRKSLSNDCTNFATPSASSVATTSW
jgi:hypothetical protein